jgi:hypothetical protein
MELGSICKLEALDKIAEDECVSRLDEVGRPLLHSVTCREGMAS